MSKVRWNRWPPVGCWQLRLSALQIGRREPTLVGRAWEMNTVAGILDQAIRGAGCVVGVVGPPGIGKSRIMNEAVTLATRRGVEVITVACESHTREVPFHLVARLLRRVFGVSDLDEHAGRARVRASMPDADPEDLFLLDDLLGIGDPGAAVPDITADARRRRLAALLKAIALARTTPAQYVIEDVHWIDEVSEAMLAELVTIVPQGHSLILITYRPEYRGALSRTPGAHTISLTPLNSAQTSALTAELLGTDPSVRALSARIADRAAGNPFFAEEMVRDLAQRGVLDGDRGAYVCSEDTADVSVPATLQATIAARIDRLGRPAKQFLYAAAVVGARFTAELVAALLADIDVTGAIDELLQVELIDQVMFTPRAGYAFRHPLIRTVAYESQLKSGRSELHRRSAIAIEQQDPGAADENAALIAENFEAAGELRIAFDWHMRAGAWSSFRDIRAARTNWQRARQVADRLPADTPISGVVANRTAQPVMRHPVADRWQHRRDGFRRTARSVHRGGRPCLVGDRHDRIHHGVDLSQQVSRSSPSSLGAERTARIDRRSDADGGAAVRGDLRQMPSGRDDRVAAIGGSTHRPGRRRSHQGELDLRLTAEHRDCDAGPRQDVPGNSRMAG